MVLKAWGPIHHSHLVHTSKQSVWTHWYLNKVAKNLPTIFSDLFFLHIFNEIFVECCSCTSNWHKSVLAPNRRQAFTWANVNIGSMTPYIEPTCVFIMTHHRICNVAYIFSLDVFLCNEWAVYFFGCSKCHRPWESDIATNQCFIIRR